MGEFWIFLAILIGIGLLGGLLSSYKWFLEAVVIIGFSAAVVFIMIALFITHSGYDFGASVLGLTCGAAAKQELDKRKRI